MKDVKHAYHDCSIYGDKGYINAQAAQNILSAQLGRDDIQFVEKEYDLDDGAWLKEIYDLAQIRCVLFSAVSGEGVGEIKELLRNRISAFSGNSGVGKSSLLNRLYGGLQLETGDISQKLGRGRHTTRQVELFRLEGGGYVADTPGFSTVDVERYELIRKEELPQCFPEFEPYLNQCKFTSCAHICEKGCAVLKAVEEGKISKSRHGSYCAMYQEVKDVKEWELK